MTTVADPPATTTVLTPPSPLNAIEVNGLLDLLREAVHLPAAMTAVQAARYLGISKPSLYRGVSAGSIPPAVQTAGGPRWRRRDLDSYLAKLSPAK